MRIKAAIILGIGFLFVGTAPDVNAQTIGDIGHTVAKQDYTPFPILAPPETLHVGGTYAHIQTTAIQVNAECVVLISHDPMPDHVRRCE